MQVAVDHRDRVLVAVEADRGVGHVVGDDQVEVLVLQLACSIVQQVFGFCGEAHAEGTILALCEGGENVGIAHQLQEQALAAGRVFLQFVRGDHFRAVVGDRRGGDQQVAGHRRLAGGQHVAGADHVDALHPVGRGQVHRAGDQGHPCAGFHRRLGEGEAHLSGTVVGDVAHRVDVFLGRAGGDQHMHAGQRLALEAVGGALRQFLGFEHASEADVAAGLAARCRTEQVEAALAQQLGVGLGRGVAPHGLVHRRCQGDLRVGGQHQGGQQVVGHALDQARHEVGGSRCDQHQIGPAGQFDVAHRGFRRRVQQIGMHRMAGQRLEGQGRDELAAALGHHHSDFSALVAQAADQFGALVGGNAAAHAEDDAFPIEPLHRLALIRKWMTCASANAPPQVVCRAKRMG
ncbi:Uncharacterized protein PAE221_01272 [Pseudomonas aeruginosa]|nr:Uncharacterized protein PAE221_01272 [Pseudomonas aeruginosa]